VSWGRRAHRPGRARGALGARQLRRGRRDGRRSGRRGRSWGARDSPLSLRSSRVRDGSGSLGDVRHRRSATRRGCGRRSWTRAGGPT